MIKNIEMTILQNKIMLDLITRPDYNCKRVNRSTTPSNKIQ